MSFVVVSGISLFCYFVMDTELGVWSAFKLIEEEKEMVATDNDEGT